MGLSNLEQCKTKLELPRCEIAEKNLQLSHGGLHWLLTKYPRNTSLPQLQFLVACSVWSQERPRPGAGVRSTLGGGGRGSDVVGSWGWGAGTVGRPG